MTREEYLIEIECGGWTSIYSCYGNLDPLVYRDCNTFPFGVPLVEGSIHEVFLKNVEVKLIGFNNIFKQGRTRNFRTEKEKIYQLFAEPVPEWLMEEIDAVFTRGEVFIGGAAGVGGTKYLVKDTAFELVDACLGLWKPSATFHTHCGMSFGCDDPCTEESGESGGGETECCDPVVTGTSVTVTEGNQITVTFVPCSPNTGGYNIRWRVVGSVGAYTDAGNFAGSPAIFLDGVNPEGTQYEGFITSDCGGNDIPWQTDEEEFTVFILNLSGGGVTIEDINFIPGFTLSGPVPAGGHEYGTHGAFTGSINVTVSGSPISGSLSLRRNGALLDCDNIGSAGSYSFGSAVFLATDLIEVRWFGGSC